MIQGAIFDADGTLLDSMGIWQDAGGRYLARRGLAAPPDLGQVLEVMSLEESSTYLSRHFIPDETPAEVREGILEMIADFYLYEAELKPGAREFLRRLSDAGIPMVIATVNGDHLIRTALGRLGVLDYFREILSCSEFQTTKREPFIFRKAAERMGTAPEHTVVFEDMLCALLAAKSAGFPAVAVEDPSSGKDLAMIRETADLCLEDFCDYERFRDCASGW